MICSHCGEPMLESEIWDSDGSTMNNFPTGTVMHRECFLRMVYGSVGHQLRMCLCYGGVWADPPNHTKRQAAHAAVLLYQDLESWRVLFTP